MRLMNFGKVAATFCDTKTGQSVRICPHPASRERAAACKPDKRSRWHGQLEDSVNHGFPNLSLLIEYITIFGYGDVASIVERLTFIETFSRL
jgi:hypothetical protein